MAVDTRLIAIAEVCWAADRAFVTAQGGTPLPPWDDTPVADRAPMTLGVQRTLDGHTAEALHGQWVESRLARGWVPGPVESLQAKTSPLLVPYAELPPEDRLRDDLFRSIVLALAGPLGLTVAGSLAS